MWLDVLLGNNKLDWKEKFFSSLKEFNKESQLILSVFFEQTDVCIVSRTAFNTMCELNPQVERDLKILASSPCFKIGLACTTQNSRKFSYIDKLIDATADLNSFTAGKQILILMKTARVRRFKQDDLKTVEQLLKEFEKLQNKKIASE
jgi:ABC-type phosphate/phosphonate transport system substrate-binding protein